jgi:hypothetical protein
MTSEQAVAIARELIIRNRRSVVLEPIAIRRMQAVEFNELFGRTAYPSDFWVVEFLKILPHGVAAETPGSVLVEVVDATQQAREVYVGMWCE